MQIKKARVDSIESNGHAVNITVILTGQKLKNVPVYYPYYHYAKGEGMYASVQENALCIVFITDDGEPFVMGFGSGMEPLDMDSMVESISDTMGVVAGLGGLPGIAPAVKELAASAVKAAIAEFPEMGMYMKAAEKMTPGSSILKGRKGNKMLVERGGFNLSYVTHLCWTIWTPIKNYIFSALENFKQWTNSSRTHIHTNYKKGTTNVDITIKDKRDPAKTDKLWVSVGDEGEYIDIRLLKKGQEPTSHDSVPYGMPDKGVPEGWGSVFQFHVRRENGNTYLYTPLLTIDGKVYITGDTRIARNLEVDMNTLIKQNTNVVQDLDVRGKTTLHKKLVSMEKTETPKLHADEVHGSSHYGPEAHIGSIARAGDPTPPDITDVVHLPDLHDKDIPDKKYHPDKENEDLGVVDDSKESSDIIEN